MPTFDEYNRRAQQYTLQAQARDPEWQAWQQSVSGLPIDLQGSIASPDKDYTAEFFGSLPADQQQEYWKQYEQNRAQDAKRWQSRVGSVMKFIPAAVGVAGLAGAAGLLGGAAGATPSAASIAGAAGLPELGLAAQTGLGIGAADAAAALGGAGVAAQGVAPAIAGGVAGGVAPAASGWGSVLSSLGAAGGAMNMGDLIGPAATIGGALLGSNAAGKAADQQQAATDAAIAEQRRQFDLTRGDFAPYRETGVNALQQLTGDINRMPTAAEVMAEPGYQFGLQQGQQGIDRKIASMGGRVSGQAIKAAGQWNNDYATGQYGAAYQRRQDRLNRLASLAGIGQTSTGASAAAGQNSSNAISGLISSQGDANAASTLSRGNTWGNAGNALAAMYGQRRQTQPVNQGWGTNGLNQFYFGNGTSGD
jgi:hypothetical protein